MFLNTKTDHESCGHFINSQLKFNIMIGLHLFNSVCRLLNSSETIWANNSVSIRYREGMCEVILSFLVICHSYAHTTVSLSKIHLYVLLRNRCDARSSESSTLNCFVNFARCSSRLKNGLHLIKARTSSTISTIKQTNIFQGV